MIVSEMVLKYLYIVILHHEYIAFWNKFGNKPRAGETIQHTKTFWLQIPASAICYPPPPS